MEIEKLASIFLPSGLLERFDVINLEEICESTGKDGYHIWLDEKNILPLSNEDYESKGFNKEKVIQDFPIRGKAVYLHVRRRVWRDKTKKRPNLKSDYKFEAKGVKLTKELADFLK